MQNQFPPSIHRKLLFSLVSSIFSMRKTEFYIWYTIMLSNFLSLITPFLHDLYGKWYKCGSRKTNIISLVPKSFEVLDMENLNIFLTSCENKQIWSQNIICRINGWFYSPSSHLPFIFPAKTYLQIVHYKLDNNF